MYFVLENYILNIFWLKINFCAS